MAAVELQTSRIVAGYSPALHRWAWLTALTSLLPITMGALTTTLDAGMAFADWPSSDGHNMLLYPWFMSARDQFVEHGHRLAGVLIGCVSIRLAVAAWQYESRRWAKWWAWSILGAVIAQGVLGGQRVLLDQKGLAFVHGAFAAVVFVMMSVFVLVTSRRWLSSVAVEPRQGWSKLQPAAVVAVAAIMLQYVLGGLLRHLGLAMHEHLGGAVLVLASVSVAAWQAGRSGAAELRRSAWSLSLVLSLQIGLGLTTWVTKYGFPMTGYVAVQQAPLQIVVRTAHTVVAMLMLSAAVIYWTRLRRLAWLDRATGATLPAARTTATVAVGGMA